MTATQSPTGKAGVGANNPPSGAASLSESILSRVEYDTNGGCWLWSAGQTADGYGTVQHKKQTQLAHRVSFEVFSGTSAQGMLVCHRCDVPQCVNPDHLFLGTQADNMADMVRKGRASRLNGQRNGRAKISDDQAREVRDLLHLKAFSASEIARSYRVSTSTIGRIKSGETFTAVWQGYAK